jgi:formylmethanofuran dehydrogenase subunit C
MTSGMIEVRGDAGLNTGVLMRGGRAVVHGSTGDFTGAEMRGGEIFVYGDAGSFACAKMRGGAVYARSGKPVPPAKSLRLSPEDVRKIAGVLGISPVHAMMYRRLGL